MRTIKTFFIIAFAAFCFCGCSRNPVQQYKKELSRLFDNEMYYVIDFPDTITVDDHYAIYAIGDVSAPFYRTTLEKKSTPEIILDENTMLDYIYPTAKVYNGQVEIIDSVYRTMSFSECKKEAGVSYAELERGKGIRFIGDENSLLYLFGKPGKIYEYCEDGVEKDEHSYICDIPALLKIDHSETNEFADYSFSCLEDELTFPFILRVLYDGEHNVVNYEDATVKVDYSGEKKEYHLDFNDKSQMKETEDIIYRDCCLYDMKLAYEAKETAKEEQNQRIVDYLHSAFTSFYDIRELYSKNSVQAKSRYPSGRKMMVVATVDKLTEGRYSSYILKGNGINYNMSVITDEIDVVDFEYPCSIYFEASFDYTYDGYNYDYHFSDAHVYAYRYSPFSIFRNENPIIIVDKSLYDM